MTPEYLDQHFHLLRAAPEQYLALAEEPVRAAPDASDGYWSRYQALNSLKRYEEALADLNKILSIEQPLFNPDDYRSREKAWVTYLARGNVLQALGRYREALDDLNRTQMLDPMGGKGALSRCSARIVTLGSATRKPRWPIAPR